MRITRQRIVDVLGPAPKPESVWEQQFDGFQHTLVKLARLPWDEVPQHDLWEYFLDLSYVELQPDLFRHLFPACLKYWYDTLLRNESAECGDSDFHYSLLQGNIADRMLSETERERLYAFFRDGFLDRVDKQRGFVYEPGGRSANAWISRFNSLGIVAPVVPSIWEEWWNMDHPGKAVSAVMYSSGLVYLKGENPIYGVSTSRVGGGGPYLTQNDSQIFDYGWRHDNVAHLAGVLSVDYVLKKLQQAARALAPCAEGEMAARVADDALMRKDVIEIRISDVVENLARANFDRAPWE
jgi:hypothetical protein